VAEACFRDVDSCRRFLTANAGSQDSNTIDRYVRTQFFLAMWDCSDGFLLPVIALHNNDRRDTAEYYRRLKALRGGGGNVEELRMDIDKRPSGEPGSTAEDLRTRLRTRFGSAVQRSLTEQPGKTNIFRWCVSRELSRCHIGDPQRPDNIIWTTNEADFERLRRTDVNVVLQSERGAARGGESERDLSTLFLVLRDLIGERFQRLLDAIEQDLVLDVEQLRAVLEEIDRLSKYGDLTLSNLWSALLVILAEIRELIMKALRHALTAGQREVRLSRLRYINIETPGLALSEQTDTERVDNYLFISSTLGTLGLHCCGHDPTAATARIRQGLSAPAGR
jgi:hypothetical protein